MPVLSSLMQMADKMSASLPILAMQAGISSAVCIVLANAVAYASASAQLLHTIIIASAFPKLNEGPTVPDEVHIPNGVASAGI